MPHTLDSIRRGWFDGCAAASAIDRAGNHKMCCERSGRQARGLLWERTHTHTHTHTSSSEALVRFYGGASPPPKAGCLNPPWYEPPFPTPSNKTQVCDVRDMVSTHADILQLWRRGPIGCYAASRCRLRSVRRPEPTGPSRSPASMQPL